MELKPTEFETVLKSLDPLTAAEIADLVKICFPKQDAEAFIALTERLSTDAIRFIAARALFRLRR
jgi:hypothetical protein